MHLDLKFLKSWGPYNVGEIARFTKDLASTLLSKGIAMEHLIEQRLDVLNKAAPANENVATASTLTSTDNNKVTAKAK